jgi:endonuclease YncB( thermonuclease family)
MTSRVALVLVILAVLFASYRGTFSSQSSGEHLQVIDGDTLQVGGDVIQLYGIDAPELGQLCDSNGRLWHCGMEAALALNKLLTLNRSSLRCSPWSNEVQSATAPTRAPQVCEVGDQDVAVLTLHTGNSLALPGAFPDYVEAERQAREGGVGIWHSDFVVPWKWRAGAQSPSRRSDSSRECSIKGVFDVDGQGRYFVPTDVEYAALTIDPDQGEKMFCSDDEARLAGWRRIVETASADQ